MRGGDGTLMVFDLIDDERKQWNKELWHSSKYMSYERIGDEKDEIEPCTYRVEWELRVLVCKGYYGGITTLADNY